MPSSLAAQSRSLPRRRGGYATSQRPDRETPSGILERHVELVRIALEAGNREQAIVAIARFFAAREAAAITADSPLCALELSIRTVNGLEFVGILTVGQLLTQSRDDLYCLANFGPLTVDSIEAALARHGLKFKSVLEPITDPENP